jgi:hypothetical protein
MKCISCGQHFFKSAYSDNKHCFFCESVILDAEDDIDLEVQALINPSGKVKAKIEEDDYSYDYSDNDDEGFGL